VIQSTLCLQTASTSVLSGQPLPVSAEVRTKLSNLLCRLLGICPNPVTTATTATITATPTDIPTITITETATVTATPTFPDGVVLPTATAIQPPATGDIQV
jgi:hypothetical protein